jgi:hypothetical protein
MEEVTGYTQEEFEAMLKVMGTQGIYNKAVANGWVKPPLILTSQERMNLVNQYRENKDIPAYFFTNGDMGKWGDLRRRHGEE